MMKDFESAYTEWLEDHKSRRSGERLRRLAEGHKEPEKLFLEKVWWPVVGSLEHLHPEYEVVDFKGGKRYLDYAYVRRYYKIAWEILGFGPHWRNINRWKFGDDWVRHCDLMNEGWQVMYLAYDDINEREMVCRRIVQQTMGRLFGMGEDAVGSLRLSVHEELLVRKMKQFEADVITPGVAMDWLGLEGQTARKVLKGLVDKRILSVDENLARVRKYNLQKDLSKYRL